MTPLRKCPDCGAPVSAERPDRCEFCGSDLPVALPATAPLPRKPAAWFRAIRSSPEYAQAMQHTPSTLAHVLAAVAGVGFGALFCLVPAFMLFASRGPRRGGWIFILVVFALLLVGVAILLSALGQALRVLRAPVQRLAAVVIDKRSEEQRGRHGSRSSTHYYVTVEDDTGRRLELGTEGEVYGVVTAGDAGVAFVLVDSLLEFIRIAIV